MAHKTVMELLSRWELLKSIRSNHEWAWEEIVHLMQPFRGDIRTQRAEGGRRIGAVFDSEAMQASDSFVNFLKGAIIPSGSDWVRLRARPPFDRDLGIKRLIDAASDKILSALSDSNFYVEAASFLKDFAVIGNACLLVEEDEPFSNGEFQGLVFEAVPIKRMWWQNGKKRRPIFQVRSFELPAVDARDFFGEGKCPTAEFKLRQGRPMDQVELAQFVYENKPGLSDGAGDAGGKPWVSVYIDCEAKHEIRRRGYNTNPYVVSRWMVVDGEEYGRGRGHLARPDAKGVNELRAQQLLAAGRFLDPPLVMEEDSLVEGDVAPGGTLYIRPFQKMAPDYLQIGTDLAVIQQMIELDRAQIRRAFLSDVFEDPDTQPRSAEESRQRMIRAQQRLAAPAESVDYDFATPLIQCVMTKMLDAGALPELEEVKDTAADVEVVFQSPFFSSQRSALVQRVYSFLSRRIGLFQATQDPSWVDDLDPDAIRQVDSQLSDVPAEIFRTEEEVEQRRMARAAQSVQDRLAAQQGGAGRGRPAQSRNPVPAQQLEELG